METNRKYFAATAAGIVLIAAISRIYMKDEVALVPARTSPEELAQLANFTRINVDGDFALDITQVQDYTIDYAPLDDSRGELRARVDNDTLTITGFGNRTDTEAAVLRIGIPVLDTLEVQNVPEITISNFTAPLMNVRLRAYRRFTFQDNVLGIFNLQAHGPGIINMSRNTLTTQNLEVEGGEVNYSAE